MYVRRPFAVCWGLIFFGSGLIGRRSRGFRFRGLGFQNFGPRVSRLAGRPKLQLPDSSKEAAKCTAGRGQDSTAEADSLEASQEACVPCHIVWFGNIPFCVIALSDACLRSWQH